MFGFGPKIKKIGLTGGVASGKSEVQKANEDETVAGILVQLPLPKQIDSKAVLFAINPKKDVDGLHPVNVGLNQMGMPRFLPCTPAGVIEILDYYQIPMEGQKAVIVGRSDIVGKPMAQLLLAKNATVTICHSRTKNLKKECQQADILVVAMGKPAFIDGSYIKEGAVVIDVGIHRVDGKLVGDVDFESVVKKCRAITPVPGGVGPMTIAMLMQNLRLAAG